MKIGYLIFTATYLALASLNAGPVTDQEEEQSSPLIRVIPTDVMLDDVISNVPTPSRYELRLTDLYFNQLMSDPYFLYYFGPSIFGISLEGIPMEIRAKYSLNPNQLTVFGLDDTASYFQRYCAAWHVYFLHVSLDHTSQSLIRAVLTCTMGHLGLEENDLPSTLKADYAREVMTLNHGVRYSTDGTLSIDSLQKTIARYREFSNSHELQNPSAFRDSVVSKHMKFIPMTINQFPG